jgi:uncharacterized protein (DUF697 family)
MAFGPLKAWRLISEADFEGIRRDAERRFQVLVAADERGDAEEIARLLAGEPHPWLVVRDPEEARREAVSGVLDLALVVARGAELSPALQSLREQLGAARVPLVTLAIAAGRAAGLPRSGEAARVAAASLGEALPALADALLAAAPLALRVALARQLLALREPLIDQLVTETARANATYALGTALAESVPILSVPLNLADIVVLTKNQLVMSYRIALACGRSGRPRDVLAEVVGVVGSGFLFRQAGRQLVGLVPLAGIPLKAAMAWAGTVAIGRAVAAWAPRGERLNRAAVSRLYREALGQARGAVRSLLGARARRRRR